MSKEKSRSESDENPLISPNEVAVNSRSNSIDVNVLPEQQQSNQSEGEVNQDKSKDCEHQSQEMINQSEELNKEQCIHNQSSDHTQATQHVDLDHQHQDQHNQTQQPSDQNLMQTNQDQNEVVDQLNISVKPNEEVQAIQLGTESEQAQWPSDGQPSQQGEQAKEQEHGELSSSTPIVTTPSEPQTPSKTKAICNAPVPIGWPKVMFCE